MASNDMGVEQAEQQLPKVVLKSHAEAWVGRRGLQPFPDAIIPSDQTTELAQESYDLFLDRQDLRTDLVRRHAVVTGESGLVTGKTLEERIKLIQSGNASAVLTSFDSGNASAEIGSQNKVKLDEIEKKLDEIFSHPGVYDRYQQGYHSQINARKGAREARTLDEIISRVNLQVVQMTREAQVQDRTLTPVERQRIQDSLALTEPINQRKRELLQDPDIFDQVRILELKEYHRQLSKDRFAETPSRLHYISELEKLWGQNKKVLVTGPTGTGKTELVRHTSRKMFNFSPFEITGHREMTPFELLGRTGLSISAGEGSDVYRPSKLVQAAVADNGKGGPFLYDEMDASPNEANIALKTILNDGPGDTISVQMDSNQRFVIGPNYSFTGTANVKSEKHLSRFEIDPAIVRVLEPMIVSYLPPNEVWDVAMATLMDRRGGAPISLDDANVTLKDLCDAAYWTQQAYLGEKVQIGSRASDFLKARGGASTGKPATLREGILDPGKLRDMLKGWEASRMKGLSLREHVDEQLVRFVNNENYPPEDRYYLVEIFALKGFFRGRNVSEFKVAGLDQRTLSSWQGRDRARQKSQIAYLRPERIAQLDPYGVLKRPISEDAESLLASPNVESDRVISDVDFELVKDLFGEKFFGPDQIKETWDIDLSAEQIPDIGEYLTERGITEEHLKRAAELGFRFELRINRAKDGSPLTMEKMEKDLQDKFDSNNKGKILYKTSPYDWYTKAPKEPFFESESPEFRWALVSDGVIPETPDKNYLQQTEVLINYLKNTFFDGQGLPDIYQEAVDEFEAQKAEIAGLMTDTTWADAARRLSELKINQITRHTPSEVIYDMIMATWKDTNKRYLPTMWTWTNARTRFGLLVVVGLSAAFGVHVGRSEPQYHISFLGTSLSL